MEVVVGIAVGVLVVVVILSTIGITCAVKKKCCQKVKEDKDEQPQHNVDIDIESATGRSDRQLIEEDDLDDVSITLQNVIDDDVSIDDMTGVMNHCIPILKDCHDLTSRLVPITRQSCDSEEDSKRIEDLAREVQPRLEDVVQLMDGPLDPRLVEARCTSLYYAVSNLCLVIKSICKDEGGISDWIDSSLQATEGHLKTLQAETQKLLRRSGSRRVRVTADCSPVGVLTLSGTHSNSSSHTDSAESGIDLQTPSEHGSVHAPHSPSYHTPPRDADNNIEDPVKRQHGSTVVEVHVGDSTPPAEVIEMKSFSNKAYTVTAE